MGEKEINVDLDLIVKVVMGLGTLLILIGLLVKKIPRDKRFLAVQKKITLSRISDHQPIKAILDLFVGDEEDKLYIFYKKFIRNAEASISVRDLFLIKLMLPIAALILFALISYTNFEAVKEQIIRNQLASGIGLYNRTFSYIDMINFNILFVLLLPPFLPEVFLMVRRAILKSKYDKEVVKLENIFELLGGANNFKTIDILREMAECSKIYRKHILECIGTFHADKEKAFNTLKSRVPNKRFLRLVDILRTYSLVGQEVSLETMVRNRMERDEELIILANENIDGADIIAFVAITPLLIILMMIILKPMFDLTMRAFSVF